MSYSEDLKALCIKRQEGQPDARHAERRHEYAGNVDELCGCLFGRLPGTAFRLPTGASDQPGTGNGHACLFQENWRKKTNLCRSQ